MKKIGNKFRVMVNAAIVNVMGVLGVTSCDVPVIALYGVPAPQDNIEVDGQVTNEEGEPLESMQVVINTSKEILDDTVYTNATGEFKREYYSPPRDNDTLLVEVNDTTGLYESEKVAVPFTEMTKETESDWEREFSVDIKVQLKKK
jgi:putative lipoprotein (rSAM/lipoprotein system)